MHIIYNKWIPFKRFIAINLFGVIFVKHEYKGKVSEGTLRHEAIHTAQMKELLYIGFYLIYLLEWGIRALTRPALTAYRETSFEVEAREGSKDVDYLKYRKHYSMWRHES